MASAVYRYALPVEETYLGRLGVQSPLDSCYQIVSMNIQGPFDNTQAMGKMSLRWPASSATGW